MSWQPSRLSRRSALGVLGAGAAATTWATTGSAAAVPAAPGGAPEVRVLLNGAPAEPGAHPFPDQVQTVTLDNGLVTFTFGRDDAAGGVVTGWTDVSITATSVVVDGVELAHHLNGVEPRDPDRQHSFYIDAAGGKSRLVCNEVRVVRMTPHLAEVAFVDTTSAPLRHEHHLIMRSGRRGLYGYDILTATDATTINEVRMNTRWDRSIFDHCFNWEHGKGRQPTYGYLATQASVQDETWRVDGVNNPNLPSPDNNAGGLAAGDVYTKYEWSLYHHQNPMFGHYGHGFGVWFTPLGGVSDQTLAAFYGVGPQHQDLAIHQDALILNYFGANHYGLPAYNLAAGYRRLYGPWLTYVTTGDPDDPDGMIAEAAAIAQQEIADNRAGAHWVSDALYPAPDARATVKGRVRFTDGRPAGNLWVLLSTQDVQPADVYTIHEPTYFVRTAADGTFSLPGVPPAWQPGTTTPGTYTLYVFGAGSSVADQFKKTGVTVHAGQQNLGTLTFAPQPRGTFLWQLGRADRSGGEYALAALSPARPSPRGYDKPHQIPADLTFTVGRDWEPEGWYYAQAKPGVWTVRFTLDRALEGTASLTVTSSMQQGSPPTVTVNGSATGVTGTLPKANDSTIARQADRSGFPRQAVLTFPAALLTAGDNTVEFTAPGSVVPPTGGFGWDTVILEVDEPQAPDPAALTARVTSLGRAGGTRSWRVEVANDGRGTAYDVRLDAVREAGDSGDPHGGQFTVDGRDPNAFPVPLAAALPPGTSVTATVTGKASGDGIEVGLSSDGGRVRETGLSRS